MLQEQRSPGLACAGPTKGGSRGYIDVDGKRPRTSSLQLHNFIHKETSSDGDGGVAGTLKPSLTCPWFQVHPTDEPTRSWCTTSARRPSPLSKSILSPMMCSSRLQLLLMLHLVLQNHRTSRDDRKRLMRQKPSIRLVTCSTPRRYSCHANLPPNDARVTEIVGQCSHLLAQIDGNTRNRGRDDGAERGTRIVESYPNREHDITGTLS